MTIKSWLSKAKPHVPPALIPVAAMAYRAVMRVLCLWAGLGDRKRIARSGFKHLPPVALRYRVGGSPNLDDFLRAGKSCSHDIEAALQKTGRKIDSFKKILDFGCGCGRTLIWLAKDRPAAEFHGTDMDEEAVAWCRRFLGFGSFEVNAPLPPLRYDAESFDLVYAISVFTHLSEDYQFRWLGELKRITRKGGVVLLTVHGRSLWSNTLHPDIVREIDEAGFAYKTFNVMKHALPEFYQSTYHTEEYVRKRFAEYFKVLDYIPKGMNNHQDVVLLERPQ